MSWLVHCWLLLYGIALFVIKDCQGLFLRHTQSGKCITRSEELVYDDPDYTLPYYVVMTDNCLDDKAQFRYLDSELLHNIEKQGTLISPDQPTVYNSRWAVYKGVSSSAKKSQKSAEYRLKQTDAESLSLYNMSVCAEPSTTYYVMRRTYCDRANQKFTFGSVTQYGTKTKDVHCSPTQHMVVKSADYGDFDNGGTFDKNANIDTQCSALTNCQVKSLCSGKRSCELTMNNNLLPSQYCSEASKEIYTKYTCVDTYDSSTITTASNIRLLTSTYDGYVQIKDDSTWRYLEDKNWDKIRQKMLCQHLGFKETDANTIESRRFSAGYNIATGDLICYKKQPSGTSCCAHLKPSTNQRTVRVQYARCKICDHDNPILQNPNAIFSGDGSKNYNRARFYNYGTGWCALGSMPYLTLDLRKEYHITRVVTMGNKDQTKWSESYSMKYSHDKTLVDGSLELRITGNQNGYQASTTNVDIYNVRHIKIQSTGGSSDFCLRIELCGEVQTPSPVSYINVTPSDTSAQVTLAKPPAPQTSSYIKSYGIYLGQKHIRTVDRQKSMFTIGGLEPNTKYTVKIYARDGSLQWSSERSKEFMTSEAERMNPVQASYSSLSLSITKPAQYIRKVMVIVQVSTKYRRKVEDIKTRDLKPYEANTQDPYVSAYLKADVLPLTFVIGDGKEYNSENKNYVNQPLKQNSSYMVFLRFFESQNLYYYSTGWSNIVKTFAKPPAPSILKIISTGLKNYTISWSQPSLPDQQTILTYYAKYGESQGTYKTLKISNEMRSVIVNVQFGKQYTFKIRVGTEAGKSDFTAKSWFSHSAPLQPPVKTEDGYTVILRKPKGKNISTVALVMLQLRSKSSKPEALENLNVLNSSSPDTKADNIAFVAKRFQISEFQNDTKIVSLREIKENRRRKREATESFILSPGVTYRVTQVNTDGSENRFWSYWSEPFTFTTADSDSNGGIGDDNGDKKKRDDASDSGGSIATAVGSSIGVVVIVIALVLVVIFLRRRQKNRKPDSNENCDEMKEIKDDADQEGVYSNETGHVGEIPHPPVPIAEFAHYVNELKAKKNHEFQKQYDDLPKNMKTSWEVAKKPFNKQKNRYGNIVTYDYCRVVLSGGEHDDYINASYIDGIKENSYIGSQGPTKTTLNDMWRMVWEQRSYSIVMVTSLVELGKPKCEKYWPDKGTKKYGDIEITLMKTEEFADHVTHTLQLKKDGQEREVRHYYFQSWPDHGVPKYPTQLLAFRRHFRIYHVEESGPIVVHCSAGVGRTGVFLAIDTILDKLEKGVINSIDVFGQVSSMRERRMNMVQTLEQYIFIHEAILESILCGMNEVDSTKVQKEIEILADVNASGMTGFQEKFKRLGEVSPKLFPDECTAALLKGNENKNRNKEIYPAENNRVPLEYVDGVENSDYINAVFVHGYLGRNYFIATQSPLPNTINDFWRMVHSQKSSTIVLLSNVKDGTSFPSFWPTERGQPKQYDSLTVQLDSQKQSDGIWTRKFILSPYPDLSNGEVVNIFHYTKWRDDQAPSDANAVITLTSLVENSRKNHGQGPIIVACSDGAGRTGTYIAISNLLERMKIEQAMDVFQSIKIIRAARPQFVDNAEQYQFCYTAVMAYLDAFSDYANFE